MSLNSCQSSTLALCSDLYTDIHEFQQELQTHTSNKITYSTLKTELLEGMRSKTSHLTSLTSYSKVFSGVELQSGNRRQISGEFTLDLWGDSWYPFKSRRTKPCANPIKLPLFVVCTAQPPFRASLQIYRTWTELCKSPTTQPPHTEPFTAPPYVWTP